MSKESERTIKYYYARRDHYLAKRKEYQSNVNDYIRQAKERPCSDCGIQYDYWIMQFDHRPDEVKLGNVSTNKTKGMKWVQREIEKCDVVCGNCHLDRTYKRQLSQ